MKLSDIPTRNSEIYCSESCGCGCKYSDYIAAIKEAKKLAKELGPDWGGRVWENCGWNFSASSEFGEVHRHGKDSYWADLRAGKHQVCEVGENPIQAVENALKKAKGESQALQNLLRAARNTAEV